MFSRADDIGAGVIALGDMLQWAPQEDVQRTLFGLGAVLRQLGGNIQTLSETYFYETYGRISDLESKDRKEAIVDAALAHLKAREAARKSLTEELKEILSDAITVSESGMTDRTAHAACHSER